MVSLSGAEELQCIWRSEQENHGSCHLQFLLYSSTLFACADFYSFCGVMQHNGLFAVTASLGTAHLKNIMSQ